MDLVRHRMDLQYDGAPFRGWSKQPGAPTVEGALEEALVVLVGTPPRLTVAGRTDAGVNARRQVVSLDLPGTTDCGRLTASLNALTPPEIAVDRIVPAIGFDARGDALSRSYRYFIWRGRAASPFWGRYTWHVRRPLDTVAMERAAARVVGRHDLTAFTPTETEHVLFTRIVERCRWRSRGELLWLEVQAPAFLRHMVRVLVGTMVEIGVGSRPEADMARLLQGAGRPAAGRTAPPQALFLWRVAYGGEARVSG